MAVTRQRPDLGAGAHASHSAPLLPAHADRACAWRAAWLARQKAPVSLVHPSTSSYATSPYSCTGTRSVRLGWLAVNRTVNCCNWLAGCCLAGCCLAASQQAGQRGRHRLLRGSMPRGAAWSVNAERTGDRMLLRRTFEQHRNRLQNARSGKFSTVPPKNFPARSLVSKLGQFEGTCYEHRKKPLDKAAEEQYDFPEVPLPLARKPWNKSTSIESAVRQKRLPQSSPTNIHRPFSGAAPGSRVARLRQGTTDDSMRRTTTASGRNDSPLPYEWGVSNYPTDSMTGLDSGAAQWPNDVSVTESSWSVDLQPDQAQTFCKFVELLKELGPDLSLKLAQAAVDQAGLQIS